MCYVIRSELGNVASELFIAVGMGVDEFAVDPTLGDEDVRQPVQQRLVGLRLEGQVLRRRDGGFGFARIENDDFRAIRVATNALPHDRMGDAKIRSDQDDDVGLLEVLIGVGRSIEAERLLIGDDRGSHTLSRIAVAVQHAHPEFGERPEVRHLFGRHLTGAEKCDGVFPVLCLQFLEAIAESFQGDVPADWFETTGRVAKQRRHASVGCVQH